MIMKKMLLTLALLVMGFVTTFAQVVKIGMMGSAVGVTNTVDDVKLFPLDGENYFAPSYELQRGTFYFRQDNSILWGATAFPSGTAVKNSDNRISIMEAGAYTINFNRISGAYSIIKDGTGTPVVPDPIVVEPITPAVGRNIYVKREGSTTAPKIHVWTNDTGNDVAITNTSSWPNNLPTMIADGDGWFKYNVNANSVGTLFRYGTFQTPDYKYYNQDVWVTLNADGSRKSVTHTDPRVPPVTIDFNTSTTAQSDGCFVEGQTVSVYVSTTTPNSIVYYTVDGSDPIPNVGSTLPAYGSIYLSPTQTRVKAVVYVNDVRVSNIITKDYCFKKAVVTITTSPLANANGKYTLGTPVTVTLTSNVTGYPIWYSTDGQLPYYTSNSKNEYTTSFQVTENSDIAAWAVIVSHWRDGRYSELVTKKIEFEEVIEFPTFTYSTTPWLNENGKYSAGANVAVTFNLSPSNNPDWDVYYSLDGNDVDLTQINTGANTLNPIRYSGVFNVNTDKVVYAKIYNVKTGQSQGVSPMIFSFEPVQTQGTIYVKREGSTAAPRIHVWTNDSGTDVAITNTSSWPNNLPFMTADTNGWFKYAVSANNVGTLFRYGSFQTPDYKYYNQDVWITLNADGSRKSVSFTKPFEETPIVLNMTKSVEPKANGKYSLGTTVTATFTSNGGAYKRYIAYTTDGSDPKTSSTYQLIVINQYTPTELVINSNTNLRAIEEGIYRSGPYSNEVAFNFQFEANKIATITKDIQPKSNGKYNIGQTVNVTIGRTEGCGGCSYADFYTVDGTDPKTSATKIAGSAFVTLPITQTTTIRAISYPAMGNPDHYTDVSETITFEAPEKTITIYVVKRGDFTVPKIHVWKNETGTDVAITNTSSWPNNLPNMIRADGSSTQWYKYTVTANRIGTLFRYGSTQSPDVKYYTENVYVVLNSDGSIRKIGASLEEVANEVHNKPAIEVVEEAEKVFTVSPNPVSSNFTVNYSTGKEESIHLNIYSLTGQLLYTESFQTTVLQKEFNAQNLRLSSGTYIVQAQSASGVETKKIVVE